MRLKSLKLFNFRNYSELSLDLSFGINIFIGDNGVGKTNILEAIYVLSLTKSNRYGTINDLIKHDAITSKINCLVDYDGYTKEYEIMLSDQVKKVYINKQEIKKIAKEVLKTRVEAKLDPMNSYNRRIVHSLLADYENIETESFGETPNRYVVIRYKD